MFSNQKSQFWINFEGLGMEKVGIFCGQLEYIKAILNILWPFGNSVEIWYIFPRFGIFCQEKSGNPAANTSVKYKKRWHARNKLPTYPPNVNNENISSFFLVKSVNYDGTGLEKCWCKSNWTKHKRLMAGYNGMKALCAQSRSRYFLARLQGCLMV
jgi:hypothetical protein